MSTSPFRGGEPIPVPQKESTRPSQHFFPILHQNGPRVLARIPDLKD